MLKHIFNHLVELVLGSPLYFTELRSTLLEGSFRQEYSSMCIVRPEKYRWGQGTSHISVVILNFWLLSLIFASDSLDQNQEKIVSKGFLSCV